MDAIVHSDEWWCSECGSTAIFDHACTACSSRNLSRHTVISIPTAEEACDASDREPEGPEIP